MKLSIITVNRNNVAGLEKTIQSVMVQTFTGYEYIIVDGNSIDNSVEIIKKYMKHITYWVSEPDSGIYNAMNKGIKQASGDYIIFMNSGDCFVNPNTLKNVFTKEYNADLLVGNVIIVGKHVKIRENVPAKITFYHFITNTLWHQATFTKRSLFDEIGDYDEQMKISSDWKFALLALVKYNKSIEILTEDIARMEMTGISRVNEMNDVIKKEHDDTIKEYFPYFYDDYQELYKLKRWSFYRMKIHIRWRLRKFLY